MKERSLVAFTLLSQVALGTLWVLSILNELGATNLEILTAIMLAALVASFIHLGSPLKAWRAIGGWRSSWLSREVLCAAIFTVMLGGLTLAAWEHINLGIGVWLAGLCGLALLISMTHVYRLRTIPAWYHWTTTASFFITALLLGALLCAVLAGSRPWLAVSAIGLLGAQQAIGQRQARLASAQADHWQRPILTLRLLAIGALAIGFFASWWIAWPAAFLLAFSGEVLARILFYEARKPRSVWRFGPDHRPFP